MKVAVAARILISLSYSKLSELYDFIKHQHLSREIQLATDKEQRGACNEP